MPGDPIGDLPRRLRELSNIPGFGVIAAGLSTAQEREVQRALVDAADALDAIVPPLKISRQQYDVAAVAFLTSVRDNGEPSYLQPWVDAGAAPVVYIDGRFDLDAALNSFLRALQMEVAA